MRNIIHTIGYARATQDLLVRALCEAGVDLLVDVRAIARSRRPGFSKSSLRAAVEQAGISYVHLRDLGTPQEGREAARRGDKATLKRVYAGQLASPEAIAQIAQLQGFAAQHRTCLLCYCEDADSCHRALLVEEAFAGWQCVDLDTGLGTT